MEPNFYGSFEYNIDDKGRISVPAQYRHALKHDSAQGSQIAVLTRGLDACIFGFPLEVWDDYTRRLPFMNLEPVAYLKFTRRLHRVTANCAIDGQGRMKIPHSLLEYAHLSREAIIIGIKNRFEIWNPEIYDAYDSDIATDDKFNEESAKLELFINMEKHDQSRKPDPPEDPISAVDATLLG